MGQVNNFKKNLKFDLTINFNIQRSISIENKNAFLICCLILALRNK
jgi:hypothetical protein